MDPQSFVALIVGSSATLKECVTPIHAWVTAQCTSWFDAAASPATLHKAVEQPWKGSPVALFLAPSSAVEGWWPDLARPLEVEEDGPVVVGSFIKTTRIELPSGDKICVRHELLSVEAFRDYAQSVPHFLGAPMTERAAVGLQGILGRLATYDGLCETLQSVLVANASSSPATPAVTKHEESKGADDVDMRGSDGDDEDDSGESAAVETRELALLVSEPFVFLGALSLCAVWNPSFDFRGIHSQPSAALVRLLAQTRLFSPSTAALLELSDEAAGAIVAFHTEFMVRILRERPDDEQDVFVEVMESAVDLSRPAPTVLGMSMSLALLMLRPSLTSPHHINQGVSLVNTHFIHLPHAAPHDSSPTSAATALIDLWEVTSSIPQPRDASDMYVAGGSIAAALDQFFETQQCGEWVSHAADYFRATDLSLPIASPPLPAEQLAWGTTGDVDLWIRSKARLTEPHHDDEDSKTAFVNEAEALVAPWTASLALADMDEGSDAEKSWRLRSMTSTECRYANWSAVNIKGVVTHVSVNKLPLQCIVCNPSQTKDWRKHLMWFDSTFVQAGMHPTHGLHVSTRAMIAVLTRFCAAFFEDGSPRSLSELPGQLQYKLARIEQLRRKGLRILSSLGTTIGSPWALEFDRFTEEHWSMPALPFTVQFVDRSAWPKACIDATTGFTHLIVFARDPSRLCQHDRPFLKGLRCQNDATWGVPTVATSGRRISLAEVAKTAVKQAPILFPGLDVTLGRLNAILGVRTTQRYRLRNLMLCFCNFAKPTFIPCGFKDVVVEATHHTDDSDTQFALPRLAECLYQSPTHEWSIASTGAGTGITSDAPRRVLLSDSPTTLPLPLRLKRPRLQYNST